MFDRLRAGDIVESGVTLTEQGVEEIIGHGRCVRQGHILPRARDQFTSRVDFGIMYVSDSFGTKNSRSLISSGRWLYTGLYRPHHRRLNLPVCKDVELAADGRDVESGHDEVWMTKTSCPFLLIGPALCSLHL